METSRCSEAKIIFKMSANVAHGMKESQKKKKTVGLDNDRVIN